MQQKMQGADPRILNDFPYTIGYPYSLIFDENREPSKRLGLLCFTEYQLLRLVCLALVSQYLLEEIDRSAAEDIKGLNRVIAGIRSPYYSSWFDLINALRKRLTKVGIQPLFPRLDTALSELSKRREERPIAQKSESRLDPLSAVIALRNRIAHGPPLLDEKQAQEHLYSYLPILHQVLKAFDFLGDSLLKLHSGSSSELVRGRAWVRTLKGAELQEPIEEDLSDELATGFQESAAVIISPQSKIMPLFPLFKPAEDPESLFLYDGHYGQKHAYICYLGVHSRQDDDSPACGRLKELLEKRQISFLLDKQDTAPWSIADSALDYSWRILEGLVGTKYFPECYLPLPHLERKFESFLEIPTEKDWSTGTTSRTYVNGFILTAPAGSGKTAFLARQVEKLLKPAEAESELEGKARRNNPNLVLFMRGSELKVRPAGISLFLDMSENLGIAAEGLPLKSRGTGGFSSFRELLEHLHKRWEEDEVEGRRLILVFDALNEAPYAEKVINQALVMVGEVACFPWVKLIFSVRQEWLHVWQSKIGGQESNPFENVRSFLYGTSQKGRDRLSADPSSPALDGTVMLEPFTEADAAKVYGLYQAAAATKLPRGDIPACCTPWAKLAPETRNLLRNPLNLHLFMVTFNGKSAASVSQVAALFKKYVETSLRERPGLQRAIRAVMGYLCKDPGRASADLTDDDSHHIRQRWAKGLSVEEARLGLSPLEAFEHEGWIKKWDRQDGADYRFVHQLIGEYLIYVHLARGRPDDEEELSYWKRHAGHHPVFAEYVGAFEFVFKDWKTRGMLAQLGRLVESSPDWMIDALTGFLKDEVASSELIAKAMLENGGELVAHALGRAGFELASSRSTLAARAYLKASVELYRRAYEQNPGGKDIRFLGDTLGLWGVVLNHAGLGAYAVEIFETLHEQSPDDMETLEHLACALSQCDAAPTDASRQRQAKFAVEIFETLHEQNPDDMETLEHLAYALTRQRQAEEALRRAVDIFERLYTGGFYASMASPTQEKHPGGLINALVNLGYFLFKVDRDREAEEAYRRAVWVFEAAPDDTRLLVPDYFRSEEEWEGLGRALTGLALLLVRAGRVGEAEQVYRRSVEVWEDLKVQYPENVWSVRLATSLNMLGELLVDVGRVGDAAQAFRRALQVSKNLHTQRLEESDYWAISRELGLALNHVGHLMSVAGRQCEADRAFHRAAEFWERLYAKNQQNLDVKLEFAQSLCSVDQYLKAKMLVDEVLALIPTHQDGKRLAEWITKQLQ